MNCGLAVRLSWCTVLRIHHWPYASLVGGWDPVYSKKLTHNRGNKCIEICIVFKTMPPTHLNLTYPIALDGTLVLKPLICKADEKG